MDTDDVASEVNYLLLILADDEGGPDSVGRTVAAAHTLAHLGPPGINALAQVLRDWGDYSYMAFPAAIEALGASGDKQAVAPLRNLIRMPPEIGQSEELRAAQALARLEGAGSNALADVVRMRSLGPEIRWAAATVLGETGDEATALAPLLAALGDRDDPLAAAGAATSLGKLHSADAVPALIVALGDEEFEFVANAAQGALYHIGEAAIPALIQALNDAPDVARRRAAWALSWLGENSRACDALFSALGDPDADVRAAAVCALHNHGDTSALPALQRIHQEDEGISADFESLSELADGAIRAIEARAAGSEEPSSRDIELAAMNDEPSDGAETFYLEDVALFEIAEMSEENTTHEIARLMGLLTAQISDEEDIERAMGAALSMARLGPRGLVALASVACNASYASDMRAAALDGLVSSRDEAAALTPLFDVLNDAGNSWLGLHAANALGALKSPAAIPGLVKALRDEQYAISGAIEQALVRIGEAAIPSLVAVLTRGLDGQRRAAARALRELSADPRAGAAFFEALSDPDAKVRELAIDAIAFPRDASTVQDHSDSSSPDVSRDDPMIAQALLPLLDDANESVRAAARNGLREVGEPDDSALLERAARLSGDVNLFSESGDLAGHDARADIASYLRLLARGPRGGNNPRVVWRAARALSHFGAQGLSALGAVLRDPDLYPRTVRIWAIDALGASEDARAIPPLLDALRGVIPDSSVEGYFADLPEDRQLGAELRAAYALVRIGTPGLAVLAVVSRDPDVDDRTRLAARDALESLPGDSG